jgi:predicted flap endonuclease-1-like 5' DNA nuclease
MAINVILLFIVGVIVGLVVAWYPARLQANAHKAETARAEEVVNEKERHLDELQAALAHQQAEVVSLQEQLGQRDRTIDDLNAQIEEAKLASQQLEVLVQERDAQIGELASRPLKAEARIGELEDKLREKELGQQSFQSRLQELEKSVAWLQDQLGQREEMIRDLNALLDWRKLTINQMTEVLVKRDDQQIEPESQLVQRSQPAQKPDNLKRIEGIGPSIAKLLLDAGIATFTQLADTPVDQLQSILNAAHLEMVDPSTWPEQAGLVASADWEALAALQDELDGGRRVSQAG